MSMFSKLNCNQVLDIYDRIITNYPHDISS